MAANNEALKNKIEASKSAVREKYGKCKVAARNLKAAYEAMIEAEQKKEIAGTSKSIAKHAKAEIAFNAAKKEYVSSIELYDALVGEVLSLYNELILSESGKGAKKTRAQSEKFEINECSMRDKLSQTVAGIEDLESDIAVGNDRKSKTVSEPIKERAEEKEIKEERPMHTQRERADMRQDMPPQYQPYYVPPHYVPYENMYRPYPPTPYPPSPYPPVGVAPASIDITPIVEDAVKAAMEKFKAAFAKSADEFTDGIEPAPSSGGVSADVCSAALVMENEIAEGEREIVEKLSGLIENIKSISEEMIKLGAAYIELSSLQRDSLESQKQVNDMQRSLSRELQGVKTHQKLINQEQAEVSRAQAALIEEQKANAENQKLLVSAAEELRELQRELAERQAEVTELQKAAMAENKQMLRSLKTSARVKARAKKTVSAEMNELIDNKLSEENNSELAESETPIESEMPASSEAAVETEAPVENEN